MSPELAGLAGIFVFAAAWEVAGMRGGPLLRHLRPAARDSSALRERLVGVFKIDARLTRAGLAERIDSRTFLTVKAAGSLGGLVLAIGAVPAAPGRLAPIVGVGLIAGGFLAPDAWAERVARKRLGEMMLALPDALDLVAVGVATGRTPTALLGEIAAGETGALASELARAVAEIDAGANQADALGALRARTGAPELGALAAAMERSRRYGSPLADQLHAQAATMRAEERRRIEERAAKAAPKIQLVVAMVLVPSALLAIAAALVAHSGSLISAI